MASIYDKTILSKSDLARINNLNDAWKSATDKKLKDGLHAQAEAIRASYGYSGGEDGAQFIVKNSDALSSAAAAKSYTDALESANEQAGAAFDAQAEQIERDKDARLREAYIKNMQDSLGLSQAMKAAGVSGGATASTRAYMTNVYNNNRNDIISDALDLKGELAEKRSSANAKALEDIAKAEYEGAKDRSDAIRAAEQTAYERELDAYKKAIDERDFNYKKSVDERDFEYQKTKDERDFNYQKENDEKDRAVSLQKSYASSSSSSSKGASKLTPANVLSLIKEGVYNAEFADILGVSDDDVRDMIDDIKSESARQSAWKMMANGIYDESFPEITGYSEELLMTYVESVLNGF